MLRMWIVWSPFKVRRNSWLTCPPGTLKCLSGCAFLTFRVSDWMMGALLFLKLVGFSFGVIFLFFSAHSWMSFCFPPWVFFDVHLVSAATHPFCCFYAR